MTLAEILEELRRTRAVVVTEENIDVVAQSPRNNQVSLHRRKELPDNDQLRIHGITHTLVEIGPDEPPLVGDVLKAREAARI